MAATPTCSRLPRRFSVPSKGLPTMQPSVVVRSAVTHVDATFPDASLPPTSSPIAIPVSAPSSAPVAAPNKHPAPTAISSAPIASAIDFSVAFLPLYALCLLCEASNICGFSYPPSSVYAPSPSRSLLRLKPRTPRNSRSAEIDLPSACRPTGGDFVYGRHWLSSSVHLVMFALRKHEFQ
eukprot:TRINITY_DN727_c0_g3_i2.p1 TRINITY_DN727_c0_g3~~TRINITY_DN727_c0_g3_i2.p1  ORF type:complete len:180 (+),score=8.40 TRINITY_DN727_c0_g3_i2:581-1120(+)